MLPGKRWFVFVYSTFVVFSCSMVGFCQSLTWLGTLGGSESIASGVSADGQAVVGWAKVISGEGHAFLWTPAGGMRDLGTLPFYSSESKALAISADGTVIVGASKNSSGMFHAFRWTSAEGMQATGTLGGSWSEAYGVSADGKVIVGDASTVSGVGHAFRWSYAEGMQDLGTLGGEWSGARDVSADGSVVIGWAYTPDREYHACRWDQGLPADLDTLGGPHSMALGVSFDGKVVVGWSYNDAALFRAFRWTQTEEMRPLSELPNSYYVWSYDVSADGQISVGETSLLSAGTRALRWHTGSSVEDLNVAYSSLLTDGSILEGARAISSDGRFIAGYGIHAPDQRREAFLLDTRARLFRLQGTVHLHDYYGDSTQVPIVLELYRNGSLVRREQVYLDSNGSYTLYGVFSASYDVAFKATHWLRLVVRGVTVTDADVYGVNADLINGDVDGDNEVTLFDFGALVAAFGAMPGDANWSPMADLDGDEEVTLFDFGVLVRNFGMIGDE
jgi:probable HAF family extracellular repeat protein